MNAKRSDPYYQAQAILARRDHAEAEMRRKLARQGFSASDIDAVLTRLKEKKLIDDRAFAQRYVASVLAGKTVGPRWVAAKLRQKQVAQPLIEEAVAEAFTPERERELAQQAAQRWRSSHVAVADDRLRLTRFLIGRGFSSEAIAALGSRDSS